MTKKHYISDERLQSLHGFLVGSKLGDAAFIQRTPKHNTYISFKHSQNQYEYLNWKKHYLNDLVKKSIKERNFTEGKEETWQRQFYFSTVSLSKLNKYREMSIINLLNELDEIGFCVWLLDDGNCYKGCWKIACGRFTTKESDYAVKMIKGKFSIDAFTYRHPTKKNKGYIRIPKIEYEKVKNLLLKQIPNDLDVVKYKLYS